MRERAREKSRRERRQCGEARQRQAAVWAVGGGLYMPCRIAVVIGRILPVPRESLTSKI